MIGYLAASDLFEEEVNRYVSTDQVAINCSKHKRLKDKDGNRLITIREINLETR